MRNKGMRILAALLLATLGTLVLVRYVESARAAAVADEQLVSVLVVDTAIEKGTAAADIAAKVRRTDVPAKLRAADAVNEVADLGNLHATADLLPGEQVVRARFAAAGTATRGEAPAGLLQVTVALDTERALGGNVRPGDTVGVLFSFSGAKTVDGQDIGAVTHLELHKVLVTGVQIEGGGGGGEQTTSGDGVGSARAGKYLVTLAIEAPAVEQVVFTAEAGKLWLAAEPKDAPEGGTKVVTGASVYTGGLR